MASPLTEALKKAKQEVFDEMVEGNGRQPVEVVNYVLFELMDVYPWLSTELYAAINFYPDYSGGKE